MPPLEEVVLQIGGLPATRLGVPSDTRLDPRGLPSDPPLHAGGFLEAPGGGAPAPDVMKGSQEEPGLRRRVLGGAVPDLTPPLAAGDQSDVAQPLEMMGDVGLAEAELPIERATVAAALRQRKSRRDAFLPFMVTLLVIRLN